MFSIVHYSIVVLDVYELQMCGSDFFGNFMRMVDDTIFSHMLVHLFKENKIVIHKIKDWKVQWTINLPGTRYLHVNQIS